MIDEIGNNLVLMGLPPVAQALVSGIAAGRSTKSTLILLPDDKVLEKFIHDYNMFTSLVGKWSLLNTRISAVFGSIGERSSSSRSIERNLLVFPSADIEWYGELSFDRDIVLHRLNTLHRLCNSTETYCLITDISGLLHPVLPKPLMIETTIRLETGKEISPALLSKRLVAMGYERGDQVEEHGSFAIRGGIVDLFSPAEELPVRIDFFGDEIENIRLFDPDNQRSREAVAGYTLIPAREILINEETLPLAQRNIRKIADEAAVSRDKREAVVEKLKRGISFHGIENLLPEFYPGASFLTDYLGPDIEVVIPMYDRFEAQLERLYAAIELRYRAAIAKQRIVTPPDRLFPDKDSLRHYLGSLRSTHFDDLLLDEKSAVVRHFAAEGLGYFADREVILDRFEGSIFKFLKTKIQIYLDRGFSVVITVGSLVQGRRLVELLELDDAKVELLTGLFHGEFVVETDDVAKPKVVVVPGNLSASFEWQDLGIVFLAERDIFGKATSAVRKKQKLAVVPSDFLGELNEGDYVVHLHHGIAKYEGLVKLLVDRNDNEFLLLVYKDGDKLYLPVDRLNLIQRYVGADGGGPVLDKLGSKVWERKQEKVSKEIKKVAKELVKLYAKRQISQGYAFTAPDNDYREFEASFPFEETDEQQKAIDDVLEDMVAERPMDRLVCGDVGFGKTEVAIRGGYKAVLDGKQVAFLVPTTVLCHQHYLNLKHRFANYPVNVDFLSRFKSSAEQRETLDRLASGKIDMIVGTHRLISKDVRYKDLGLLIVDEEHRFGVMHKERIKQLKQNLDVLTLTATPIPRTLHLAFLGLRDISLINTPPVDRQEVKNRITRMNDEVIVEAVTKELNRGGQVFFVHNRVQDIERIGAYLIRLIPQLKLTIVHGQMDEGLIEERMLAFIDHRFDLLLTTTIIESGLDIPNANTIIINRADTFGLSQLYQLRGRVGRSKRRAYAYLLVPENELVSEIAQKRLLVIDEFSKLGSGYKVASHDLELRGGGNILGEAQTGHIAAIGLELYTQMLENEIMAMRGEDGIKPVEPTMTINIPAFIPDDFVLEPNNRIRLYRRFSSVDDESALVGLVEEVQDRYGHIPLALENFIEVIRLKLLARRIRIKGVEISGMVNSIQLLPGSLISIDRLLELIHRQQETIKLTPDNQLIVQSKDLSKETVFGDLRRILINIADRERVALE